MFSRTQHLQKTRNQITEGARYPGGKQVKSRGVDVVLDAKSFSEVTLRQLLALLSKRFPEPDELLLSVYTNLDDVLTPEEAEHIPPLGNPIDLSPPKYAWAFYVRSSEDEHFTYHTKEPGSEAKTVTLRDKDMP